MAIELADLTVQNPWWISADSINRDPRIRDYENAAIKWMPRLRYYLDSNRDGMYSVRGPRQVGKTTLVKLIIREELKTRKPSDIFYYACDLINTAKELNAVLGTYIDWASRQGDGRKLICLDEVQKIPDWESAYKFVADTYSLEKKTFLITGSSSWDLKHGIERLGGRKGEYSGASSHKILVPMKFAEYLELRKPEFNRIMLDSGLLGREKRKLAFQGLFSKNTPAWVDNLLPFQSDLNALVDEYMLTGGIMPAVNQLAAKMEISNSTYEAYLQLFFGDVARLKRDESTAKKVLSAVIRHQGKPVGWTTIKKNYDIPTSVTVAQYAEVLQTLFVLNVYHSYDQNRGEAKFRSEKKLQIPNAFFYHAFRGYLTNPAGDYFAMAKEFTMSQEGKALLAEFMVGDHLTRLAYGFAPRDLFDQSNSVFYSRNRGGEGVDFIVRLPGAVIPVEVCYQQSIGKEDYKNLYRFGKGIQVTKQTYDFSDKNYPTLPLPFFLLLV